MIRFATPFAFFLFIPWAFTVYRMLRRARSQALPFPGLSMIPAIRTWRQCLGLLPPLLIATGTAALVVAAARPQSLLSREQRTTDAIAIEMVVDVSGSMQEADYARAGENKTRLDVVKETFTEFVKQRPNDLIGLVAFGGYATTRSPLTLDQEGLLHVLSGVKIPGQDGEPVSNDELQTAIGDGLAMAVARLADATNIESRIVVLLSDGENNAGIVTPEQATAVAKQQRVKVYTIGIGTISQQVVGYGLFGRPITRPVAIDESTLKAIAKETDGLYFKADNRIALEEALAEIDKLQKTSIDQTVYYRYREHYLRFLISGLLCIVLALFLTPKSRRSLI